MEWLAQTEHLGLDDGGEVYLLDLGAVDPDHAHLGGINEGAAYRRCPREFTGEWWTLEDAWAAECADRIEAADIDAEECWTFRNQQMGDR